MKENTNSRFYTIDSLRGIAALSVVFFHLYGALKVELEWLPKFFDMVISYGYLGVPIFFVLSGFVISLSVGDSKATPKFIVNFAFRRSLRLDPPYWVAMSIAVCLIYFKYSYLGFGMEPPTIGSILAHMFYFQDILNINPSISVVYWTLCLEIQFYLVFIIITAISQSLTFKAKVCNNPKILLFLSLGLVSLLVDHRLVNIEINGLFIQYWHYFLIGVLTQLAIKGAEKYRMILLSWLFLELLMFSGLENKSYILAAVLISFYIYKAGVKQKLNIYLHNRILNFFGKISYSLYLLHADIGWKTISICKKIIGNEISALESIIIFLTGLGVSIIGAYLLYRFVELPFVRFSKRFKLNNDKSTEALTGKASAT